MEDPTSKIYTGFAFVSVASIVLSTLYRKKQTRIVCNTKFWDDFWKYSFRKSKCNDSIHNLLLTSDHELHQQLIEQDIATITRLSMYNIIYNHQNIKSPSHSVKNHIIDILNNHFNNILNSESSSFPVLCTKSEDKSSPYQTIQQYLNEHPLRILVPLCGCSYDLYFISKLLSTEYKLKPSQFKIIGIEVSATAIYHFFEQNNMVYTQSRYNPKYMKHPDFFRIRIFSNMNHSIHIIQNDIFKYFKLCQHLQQDIGIANSPCLIRPNSMDLVIDINAMSCINPSDRYSYIEAIRYWMKDKGLMLLNTYCYDPKLSDFPPYTIHHKHIHHWFGENRYKLLGSMTDPNHIDIDSISQSWLIKK